MAVRAARLHNKQSALLAIASEHSAEAQLAKGPGDRCSARPTPEAQRKHIREQRKRADCRQMESGSRRLRPQERKRELDGELEAARATAASCAPAVDVDVGRRPVGASRPFWINAPAVA